MDFCNNDILNKIWYTKVWNVATFEMLQHVIQSLQVKLKRLIHEYDIDSIQRIKLILLIKFIRYWIKFINIFFIIFLVDDIMSSYYI